MNKNILRKSLSLLTMLLTCSTALWADLPAQQTEDNGKVKYLVGASKTGFNIHVNFDNSWKRTTYADNGYHTVISFDGGATREGVGFNYPNYGWGSTGDFEFGKTYVIGGVEVTLVASIPDPATGAVTVKYYMTNTNATAVNFKIGTFADTMVGSADNCNVYKEGTQTVVMENDVTTSSEYGLIYKIMAITPFDTMWFGYWGGATNMLSNIFTDAFEYTKGTDSAIAWSWNVSLEPGESAMREIGSGETVSIFNQTKEIDVEVPAFLGKDASGNYDGSATDLCDFLESYLKDSPAPYYIKLHLLSDARYVISQPLKVNTAITIEGMDEKYPAVIDASNLNGAFLQMTQVGAAALTNIKDYNITMYDVTLKNFVLKDMRGQLFNSNSQKFLIPYFTVDNIVFRMTGASSMPVFDFRGAGYVENLAISNSTFSADDATTWSDGGFFNAQGGATKADCDGLGQKLSLTNCTLYNISKGKTSALLTENSQPYMSIAVNNNVIINSGKEGEFVKGLNSGVSSHVPYLPALMNSFLWTTDNENYADIAYKETNSLPNAIVSGNIECEDIIGFTSSNLPIYGITAKKLFSNGKEASIYGDFSLENCKQKEAGIGDPRWLFPSKLEKYITYASLDDDKDLGKAINEYVKDGFSQFVLEDYGQYEVRQPIVVEKGLLIKGLGAIIHANTGEALIQLSETPVVEAVNDYYRVSEITLKGLTIKGLRNSLVYDNNVKYCVENLNIDDCVVELTTEAVKNDALISFQGGGVKDFCVKNSTVFGNSPVAKYFARYNNAARVDRFGYETSEHTTVTYENNTFYNVNTGNWANYSGISNYTIYSVVKNIWVNCGDGETARRILGNGRLGTDASATFALNTYFLNGEAVSQDEYDTSGTALTTYPGFEKPENGNFTLYAYTEQAENKTGDPRWYVNGVHYYDTGISNVVFDKAASEKTVYDIQGRRVSDTSRKGVYIVNGRKVVIK